MKFSYTNLEFVIKEWQKKVHINKRNLSRNEMTRILTKLHREDQKIWTFKKHFVSKIYFSNCNIGRGWILFIPCDSGNPNPRIRLQYQHTNHNISVITSKRFQFHQP